MEKIKSTRMPSHRNGIPREVAPPSHHIKGNKS
jgi:hypothetical protein